MKFKTLSIVDAEKKMSLWKESSVEEYLESEIDSEYRNVRDDLISAFEKIKTGQKYVFDYSFGMFLYGILQKYGFTLRDAANDDVWRFLSLCVVPDIVGKRWGKAADIRYYKQSGRIWLKTIWWYIHLSWQGNVKKTVQIIKENSTDQILQMVDRSGSKGYFVEVYRKIMYYYWVARKIDSTVGESEFRKIMTLHTAVCKTIEPDLYEAGADGYAKMLFAKLGVELNEK